MAFDARNLAVLAISRPSSGRSSFVPEIPTSTHSPANSSRGGSDILQFSRWTRGA